MSDTDYDYYDDLAEQYEAAPYSGGAGGGGAAKKKYKAKPTTVGRARIGGTQAWGTTEKRCPASCTKKCCVPV